VYLPGPVASAEQAEPKARGSRHDILLNVPSPAFISFVGIVARASVGALPSGE
jgi:hypothetical protein